MELLLLSTLAATQALACPATISDAQTLTTEIVGWTIRAFPGPRLLRGVTVFMGPPEEHFSVQGVRSPSGVTRWSFFPQ